MRKLIAIQPDDYTAAGRPAESDASSPRWARLLQAAGHDVKWVEVRRADVLEQLADCHGLMWRWAHFAGMFQIAQRILRVAEGELELTVYPDQNTCWHYDDKIAQAYLFKASSIPAPLTWCWFSQSEARAWLRTAQFPLVLKLARGAGSQNVTLLRSQGDAEYWLQKMFSSGVATLGDAPLSAPWPPRIRLKAALKALVAGRPIWTPPPAWPIERNYFLLQEFLQNNAFDTRITVIGHRAFGFRRFNREGDFRASGSGRLDYDPGGIDPGFVRLAFKVATALKLQSCAIDGLYRDREHVVAEVSYTYISSAVHDCPGHWVLQGTPDAGKLIWHAGSMWPEEAQVEGFLSRLGRAQARSGRREGMPPHE
jgi:glutathione synthase/RimK-type ligase-like ATP-grasp enzyme